MESLQENENYQNVVISEDKSVEIADRPPSDEIPGGDAVYAVSLKKVTKKPGLPSDMIQKIASLHENTSKIVARKSQEFEDFVDIEKVPSTKLALSFFSNFICCSISLRDTSTQHLDSSNYIVCGIKCPNIKYI